MSERETAREEASREEIAARYAAVPVLLDGVLADLAEPDLDLARRPGAWTIRQIVHHIVDADDLTNMIVKAAIGSPGSVYRMDWYDPGNTWVKTLNYAGRAIAPATALFRASRRHIEQLLERVPGAWECHVMLRRSCDSDATKVSVRYLVQAQIHHALHHIAQIRATREVHDL